MHMRKRSISIILALALTFCLIPAVAFAGEDDVMGIKSVTFSGSKFTPSGPVLNLSVPYSFTGTADLSTLQLEYTDDFNSAYTSQGFTLPEGKDLEVGPTPKSLQLNYKDDAGEYKTIYSVYLKRAAKVDAEFEGTISKRASVKEGAVKLTQKEFTDLYTQNDGASFAGVYIAGGDSSVAAVKLGTAELDTVSGSGAQVTAAQLGNLTVLPKKAGSTSFRLTAYDADGATVGAASLDVDVIATTVMDPIAASITQLQILNMSTLDVANAFKTMSGKDLAAIKVTSALSQGTIVSNYRDDSNYGAALVKDKLMTAAEFAALTYIPNRNISRNSTETVKYTAYDEDDNEFTGTITITITYQRADLTDLTANAKSGSPLSLSTVGIPALYNRSGSGTFSYVEFKLPSASEGELIYGSGKTGSKVTENTGYYASGAGKLLLNNVNFVPSARFTGSTYIYYTAYNTNSTNAMTGRIRVTVSAAAIGSFTGEIARDEVFSMSSLVTKINNAFKSVTGTNFNYVRFPSLPNSSTEGTLYYNYNTTKATGTAVKSNYSYYRTGSSNSLLSDVSFVPAASSRASTEVEISFDAYDTANEAYSGTIILTVDSSKYDLATVSYTTNYNTNLKLSSAEINAKVRAVAGSRTNFDYIVFTSVPSTSDGSAYYNYNSSTGTGTRVTTKSSYNTYYYSGSRVELVDDLTVVPAKNFSGNLEFEYTAYVTSRESYNGKIVVTVKTGSSTLDIFEVKTSAGKPVTMSLVDFTNALSKQSNSNLNYVTFTAPSTTYGSLYYNYVESTGKYSYRVGSSDKFYRRSSGGDLLSNVTFVPNTSYSGSFVLNYTAYDENDKSFSGTIKMTIGGGIENMTDIDSKSPYYKGVKWALDNGIADPDSATSFGTRRDSTRAEIVYYMWNAAGKPEPRTTVNKFTDIKTTDYYYKAVLWAVEEMITYGTTATTFTPGRTVNRGEAMCFLYRQIGSPKPKNATNPFYDIPADYYCHDAVSWANENGVTVGTDTTHFSPKNGCIKGQIITFLYRHYVEKVGH